MKESETGEEHDVVETDDVRMRMRMRRVKCGGPPSLFVVR